MILRWICDVFVLLTVPIGFVIGLVPNLIFIAFALAAECISFEERASLGKSMLLNMGYKESDFVWW